MTLRTGILRHGLLLMAVAAAAVALSSCDKANDDRIPPSNVYLPLTQGQWNVYGPGGAGDYGYFIKSRGIPEGFPYAAMHETGYAGILLVIDYMGTPVAYSLACPVERSNSITLTINDVDDRQVAQCPECGSTFDAFANHGTPLSGPALDKRYALTPYSVTSRDGYPVVITE